MTSPGHVALWITMGAVVLLISWILEWVKWRREARRRGLLPGGEGYGRSDERKDL